MSSKFKKTTAWILTLAMIFTMLPSFTFTASAAEADGITVTIDTRDEVTLQDTDGDGYYEIGTADELYAFAAAVNGANNAINGELTADIEVNQNVLNADGTLNGNGSNFRAWTPIATEGNAYNGQFCGNEHTISGLYFVGIIADYVGLFGSVGRGEVNHVGVIDSYLQGNDYVGGVVGKNDAGTVKNCYNTGTVFGSENIGGVVGFSRVGTVTNCYNTGIVCGDINAGGVVGCAGEYYSGTVTSCYNSGTVYGYDQAGGIVGYNNGIVTNCYNTGTVSGNTEVGGVVGYSFVGTVENCYNTGSVTVTGTGSIYVGGVVGYGNSLGTISNCYNTGSVTGSRYVGGVVGDSKGTVQICYYLADSETDSFAAFKTAAQFASGEVAYLLNGSTSEGELVWKQTFGENGDDAPNFTGSIVYQVQNCNNDVAYSNTNKNIGHNWENGTCTVCSTACSHNIENNVCTNCGFTYYNLWVGGVQVNSGNATDVLGDGKVSYDADNQTLTLSGAAISTASLNGAMPPLKVTDGDITLVLVGENTLTGTDCPGILIERGASLTVAQSSTGSLDVQGQSLGYLSQEKIYVNSSIAGEGDFTVSGGTVNGSVHMGGNIKITGGTVTAGFLAAENVIISSGTVTAAGQANVSYSDKEAPTGTYGIYADKDIQISGGSVTASGGYANITESYNLDVISKASATAAMYAGDAVTISGGTVNATGGVWNGFYPDNLGYMQMGVYTEDGGGSGSYETVIDKYGKALKSSSFTISGDASFTCGDGTPGNHSHSYADAACTSGAVCAFCGTSSESDTTQHTMDSTTGKCVCGLEMAEASATVGGVTIYYSTLSETVQTVASATAEDNAIVKLLKNVTMSITTFPNIYGVFTLDLNGNALTGQLNIETSNTAVTVTDSKGDGKISGGSYGVNAYENTTVTIRGGSISGTNYDINSNNASITLTLGTEGVGATFPDGISVSGTTLGDILGEGLAYWGVVDGKETMLTVAEDATGITDKGDITIRAICDHSGNTSKPVVAQNGTHSFTCTVCQTAVIEEHTGTATYSLTDDGTQHVATWSCCGAKVTEDHDFDNDAHKCVCGKKADGEVSNINISGKTYDGSVVTAPTYDKLGDGAVTIEYKVRDAEDSTYTTTAPKNAGDYVVRVTAAEGTNHEEASATAEFSITPADFREANVTLASKTVVYDGSEQKPAVTVTWNGMTLTENTDYVVYYLNNVNANSSVNFLGTVYIDGINNFVGRIEEVFEITRREITITADDKTAYIGSSQPELTYTVEGLVGSDTLTTAPTLTTDADMTKTGTYAITVSGAEASDNYTIKYVAGTLAVSTRPSSGGSSYTPPAQNVTVPISGDDNTIHVDASVSGDKATVDDVALDHLDTVIGDDVDTGIVTIDFSGLNSKEPITTVEIPSNVVKEISAAVNDPTNDAQSLEVVFSNGLSIEFDAVALGKKTAQADGLDITISIENAKDARPNQKQEAALKGCPAYDITVTSGGEHISDMGGKITIHAPYELQDGEHPRGIIVWYVDEDGKRERCQTSYDNVKKQVNWKTDHLSLYMIDYCHGAAYDDVDTEAWYHEAVDYVIENELMGGYGGGVFKPNGNVTRQQVWMILARMSGKAPADMAEARVWAMETGVSDGTNPTACISRQQFATMLWRYAKETGVDVSMGEDTNILSYTDAFDISEYAIPAMQWACGAGVMGGYNDGSLKPLNNATRAHLAKMLMNYLEP